jgi:hypothetical protein
LPLTIDMMYEIELGLTNDELKQKLKALAVPDRLIEGLFYKDKKTNFLIFVGTCLLSIGILILRITR